MQKNECLRASLCKLKYDNRDRHNYAELQDVKQTYVNKITTSSVC